MNVQLGARADTHHHTSILVHHMGNVSMDSGVAGRSSLPGIRLGSSNSLRLRTFYDIGYTSRWTEVSASVCLVARHVTRHVVPQPRSSAACAKAVSNSETVNPTGFEYAPTVVGTR
jgi:hypothetical protein